MDKIRIRGLEVFAHHGVYPEENTLGQKFLLNVCLYTDTRRAGLSDELQDSVNYGEVCHHMTDFMQKNTCRLLERAAELLVRDLLLTWETLQRVDLEIQKPWAPVGLPLETVSVEISRSRHTAYIALGSNMGDRRAYLDQAVAALKRHPDCQVRRVSDYLVTAPYGGVEQADFLNGALELCTLLPPEELLCLLHTIEQEAHRERLIRWGPRTLDLDILLYDNQIVDTPDLHIPHVEMHLRDFVLIPLAQIAPWVRHPLTGQTVQQMLDRLSDTEN
ncbi:MAG: 2-amino-4-hydroxy-6-hydroxymethyldihydropteridine diphosphokinase [Lachnospiraceae bacterium]|jgi:dihydroneopterin aldolase/2-amino-4-hydroxy-6-hydroxymethyldihydropteridine diphosphokinase|nr:2-amino-4-hydroxy-6-hydroxymethyldihydropteridine diphosphokinase [Lachnospiraceae bacterium]